MSRADTTCWTMIRGAAGGNAVDRRSFAARYSGLVRAYLLARWQGSTRAQDVDDAIQEVFVESFKEGGALSRVDAAAGTAFRSFLLGVVRNVARRFEVAARRGAEEPDEESPAREERLSRAFDRAWAQSIMQEAAVRHRERAVEAGAESRQRVDLLRLRFHEGLPIRRIASLWDMDAGQVHREYARARREFRAVLEEVVAFHHPGSAADVERECATLLAMLS